MIRYIYILGYKKIDGRYTLCKVDIDYNRIILYGCKEADRHPERRYIVSRQPITNNGKITLCAELFPSKTYMS